MIAAKLRRSRDVPEHETVKIQKRFSFHNLAMFQHGFFAAFEKGESVPQSLDLSKRSHEGSFYACSVEACFEGPPLPFVFSAATEAISSTSTTN